MKQRRLNFISGEDFYFLAYAVLLVLRYLGGSNFLIKDHRKIVYLIQIIADERLVNILSRSVDRKIANLVDRELLFSSYTTAELHKREVFKIILSLERRGYVEVERTATAEIISVRLILENVPEKFFDGSEFDSERERAKKISKIFSRLSTLGFDTLIDRMYAARGVVVWAS